VQVLVTGLSDSHLEVVVARYRESIAWTRNVPKNARVVIYDKGGDLCPRESARAELRRLENVGFEAHSYLHHIVTRYQTLAPVTVFCQGHPFDHARDLHKILRRLCAGTEGVDEFRWLGFIVDSDDPAGERLFVNWYKNRDKRRLELERFCMELLGESARAWSHFHVGAQFAINRELVWRQPKSFYERARAMALEFPDGAACFERVWDRVFGVVGVDPAILDGALCRYLKPVRCDADGSEKVRGRRVR